MKSKDVKVQLQHEVFISAYRKTKSNLLLNCYTNIASKFVGNWMNNARMWLRQLQNRAKMALFSQIKTALS